MCKNLLDCMRIDVEWERVSLDQGCNWLNELRKKLIEKKRSIVHNNQEKGNYNQET